MAGLSVCGLLVFAAGNFLPFISLFHLVPAREAGRAAAGALEVTPANDTLVASLEVTHAGLLQREEQQDDDSASASSAADVECEDEVEREDVHQLLPSPSRDVGVGPSRDVVEHPHRMNQIALREQHQEATSFNQLSLTPYQVVEQPVQEVLPDGNVVQSVTQENTHIVRHTSRSKKRCRCVVCIIIVVGLLVTGLLICCCCMMGVAGGDVQSQALVVGGGSPRQMQTLVFNAPTAPATPRNWNY